MSQPPLYTRQFNFAQFSAQYPTTPQPGVDLDAEFNAVKATADAILTNLALIQRDDGALANSSVGVQQLKPELIIGVNPPTDWTTATDYTRLGDVVYQSNALYLCIVTHTSGVFATDLAANKWVLVIDYTDPLGDALAAAQSAEEDADAAMAAADDAEAAQAAAEAAQVAAEAAQAAAETAVAGLSLPLPITLGGHGGSTAAQARTNLAAAGSAITISAGTGLSGGGDLTANRTFNLANTSVAAAAYGSATKIPNYTVDAQGRLTASAETDLSATLAEKSNPIINGDMNVWQRGTTFTGIGASVYSADRWKYFKAGAVVHDALRSTDVPSVAQAGRLFNYSLHLDVTTADAAIASTDVCQIFQPIEGFNFLPFAQRSFTISFWVKAAKTGIHCVSVQNSGADRSCVKEYTINQADTWEFKTVTFPASPSAGTWDYTTGVGLYVYFILAAGSNFQGAADAWQSSDVRATANQVNELDNTANNFRITGVQMQLAPRNVALEPRTFNEELELCQRYYEKSFSYATAPAQNVGVNTGEFQFVGTVAGASTNFSPSIQLKVQKRAAVAATFYNPSAANAEVRNHNDGADCSGTTAVNGSEYGFVVQTTGNAGLAVGERLGVHWTVAAEL